MARLIYISFYRLHIYLQYTWSHKVESGKKKQHQRVSPGTGRNQSQSVRLRPGREMMGDLASLEWLSGGWGRDEPVGGRCQRQGRHL